MTDAIKAMFQQVATDIAKKLNGKCQYYKVCGSVDSYTCLNNEGESYPCGNFLLLKQGKRPHQ